MNKQELYKNGIDEAKKSYAIGENILFVITIMIGFIGMYPLINFHGIPIISMIYAIFLVLMLTFVIRKHLCTHCYYYDKWCHCGWGKLAARLGYEKGSGNQQLGAKLAGLTWAVLMVLPIIGMIIVFVIDGLSYFGVGLLVVFIILVGVNGGMHVKDCKSCKVRFICLASGAKK
ncbi:MAG: hypothetical protein QMC80_04585 [Thermoplasmatales archaeon]|nr:hypothetical protein [Thermoplasmatales archaeon]